MKLKLTKAWYEARSKAEEECMDATAGEALTIDNDTKLTVLIAEVLAKHDPIGLVPICGEREYDGEVVLVLDAVLDSSSEDVLTPKLRTIFEDQFGESATSFVTSNDWQLLVNDLWNTWLRYPKAEQGGSK